MVYCTYGRYSDSPLSVSLLSCFIKESTRAPPLRRTSQDKGGGAREEQKERKKEKIRLMEIEVDYILTNI